MKKPNLFFAYITLLLQVILHTYVRYSRYVVELRLFANRIVMEQDVFENNCMNKNKIRNGNSVPSLRHIYIQLCYSRR